MNDDVTTARVSLPMRRSLHDEIALRLGRALIGIFAPAGDRARLTILIHHRVRRAPDPLFPGELDAEHFERHLGIVSALFNVLPLAEALRRLRDGTLPARPAAITFDDGYADNAEVALPILQRHRLHATFFVSTGFLDGGRMWNDTIIESLRIAVGDILDLAPIGLRAFGIATVAERRATIKAVIDSSKYLPATERDDRCREIARIAGATLPGNLMMTTDQVRALHLAGMGIGAHTVSHPILSRIPEAMARREIGDGRDALEAITRTPVTLFAYPNGKPGSDYRDEHVRIVRSLGFAAALSTGWGAATRASDVFQLPRFTPWDRTAPKIALRFMRNLTVATSSA